ncbi:hemerythrin [Shewanella sp. SNU WT4]|uniref:hemerythrin domain-containing protein n=1 Tax=Shewanella sp. SNU WT4 TaxID=2590015 RepID=UPI00112E6026|nr:hemerythrin domain-containing protein [Shewanella sp. SNU WT4]QDF66342.1 hemerythrin [Shewanella sp. SNU WT4]
MLKRLMQDHRHISILLSILERKTSKLESGENINFNLVKDIVSYMQEYAEHSHHPLEDIVYEYYLEKTQDKMTANRLAGEHIELNAATAALMASLTMILNDVVIPREKLIRDLHQYVTQQRSHMHYEETAIFPELEHRFSPSDWEAVGDFCQIKLIEDPLFSDNDTQLFQELKDFINTDS